jgi:tryptophan-rich sensory protein
MLPERTVDGSALRQQWRSLIVLLVDIVLLWCGIVAMLLAFWRVRRLAGWLFVPYLLWITSAVALNATIWRLHV